MSAVTANRIHHLPLRAGAVIAATAVCAASVMMVRADAQQAPQFAGPVSFADVVERVSPAVVNIAVEKVMTSSPAAMRGFNLPEGMPEDFFGRFFGNPGARPEQRSQALGSGFVIDADGYIVTNNHVIANADEVEVIFADGETLSATIVGADERTDLALLKVSPAAPLPEVAFGDSSAARVGEWVLAIGNPFGLGGSATAGIISARGRDIRSGPYDDYLQIDAPINSGNSGGPVFNAAGEVIGVNTAILSPSGGNVGIGFAIPAEQAAQIIADLREDGEVSRGWLGVQIQDLDADLAGALALDAASGALVAEVVNDSPAAAAGLQSGDVILALDGRKIESSRDLSRWVAAAAPGARIELEVYRDGRSRSLDVRLGDLQATAVAAGSVPPDADASGTLGLQLEPLTPQLRRQLNLPPDAEGAVVAAVKPRSPAADKGLARGDVITAVNQAPVSSPADVARALRGRATALLEVRRGEARRFVAVPLA